MRKIKILIESLDDGGFKLVISGHKNDGTKVLYERTDHGFTPIGDLTAAAYHKVCEENIFGK